MKDLHWSIILLKLFTLLLSVPEKYTLFLTNIGYINSVLTKLIPTAYYSLLNKKGCEANQHINRYFVRI